MSTLSRYVLSQPISRRTLFKLFSVSAVGGVLGYSRLSKPQPTVFQPDSLDLPKYLNQAKSVVVVGGGLAGTEPARVSGYIVGEVPSTRR